MFLSIWRFRFYSLVMACLAGHVYLAQGSSSVDDCCYKLTVGGVDYELVDWKEGLVSQLGCKDGCTYLKTNVTGPYYCFKEGSLDATCKVQSDTSSCRCGVKNSESRIVGGQETGIDEWPWYAGIAPRSDETLIVCGATILSENFVVSAAHCFYTSNVQPGDVKVIIGGHDITNTALTPNRKVLAVSAIINHPNYDDSTLNNDIALLKLATKIDVSVHTPACLPPKGTDFTGLTGFIYGYGALEYDTGDYPDVLMEVDVPIISNQQCLTYYPGDITTSMLCAFEAGKDSCQGDSGGPMSVVLPGSNQEVLAGIVSWGTGCATNPGVYANVSTLVPWIQSTMAALGGAGETCARA